MARPVAPACEGAGAVQPEDIDLGAIKTDLEFLIERVTQFRKEQALKPLYTMIGSAAIVIAWIELFWRHCL